MIVDGKVRKMKFSERVRENFERFKEIVERRGRDVLVAGIIGAGILVGGVKAQGADSLVVDTSSVHIDSTYIDWSKPRFMGLTYGYYKEHTEWMAIWVDMKKLVEGLCKKELMTKRAADSILREMYPIPKGFPYYEPQTSADTIEAIIYYFRDIYRLIQGPPIDTAQLNLYIRTHPNKAASIETDWNIIRQSPYWPLIIEREYGKQ